MLADIGYAGFALLTPSSVQIVDQDAARLDLPNEECVGLPGANHITLCKFHAINIEKYALVLGAILNISDYIVTQPAPCM